MPALALTHSDMFFRESQPGDRGALLMATCLKDLSSRTLEWSRHSYMQVGHAHALRFAEKQIYYDGGFRQYALFLHLPKANCLVFQLPLRCHALISQGF